MAMRTQHHGLSLVGGYQDSPSGPFGGHATLADGLVSVYKLSDVTDSYGSNTLTNNNGTTFVAGMRGNAASFVQASQKSLTRAYLPLDMSLGVTLVFWGQILTGAPAQAHHVSNGGQAAAANDHLFIGSTGAGNSRVFIGAGDGVSLVTVEQGGGNATLDTWHLWIGWYDPATKKVTLAKDNTAGSASVALADHPAFTVGLFGIGCGNITNVPGVWTTGYVDECLVYNRVLTAQERTDLWNGGAGLFY